MSFAGLRVLSLESRRAQEMESLIRKEQGTPFVAPSVQEKALEDQHELVEFVERLEHGEFEMLICMTGVGLSFLRDVALARLSVERLAAALRRVTILSRGPKPLRVLHEMDVRTHIVVPEPNTWKEILDAVRDRSERRIAVQEYGRPSPELTAALENLGRQVTSVPVYRWQLPADMAPLREAVKRLAARLFDVVLFTSSIQLDHLLDVAREMGLEDGVRATLQNDVAIASVGPVMTASLESCGLAADITPVHPKMGALIRAASELSAAAVARKRAVRTP